MPEHGVLLIGATSIITGLLFAQVGRHVARRTYDDDVRTVAIAFALAWGSLAFIAINDGLRALIGTYLPHQFPAYAALATLKILANGAMIWGLGVYVTYLWFGPSRTWSWSIGAFAFAHSVFFLYGYQVRNAVGTTPGGWVPRLVFDGPAALPPTLGAIALPFYFLPPVILVVTYALFARRLHERTLRFRILATALAVVVFQAANMFHSNPRIPGDSAIFPILALSTLLAGLVAYASYYPPAWLARMAGLHGEHSAAGGGTAWRQQGIGGAARRNGPRS